jgi:2-oxoglutarate ferredoxin oxidoreductase subunit alpha
MTTKGTDIQIALCGSAGDGTIAVGDILKQAMARAGYRVIAFDQYPAEIRGFGKCVSRTRITSRQVYSMKPESDVLVSLDDSHAIPHVQEVRNFGAVAFDTAPISMLAEGQHISGHLRPGQIPYGLSMRRIAEETTGSNRGRNMVALGFLAGLYGLPEQAFLDAISSKFKTKPEQVTVDNTTAFRAGYEQGNSTYRFDLTEVGPPAKGRRGGAVMMSGNAAVVQGCLDAGIDNFFGYPITPATTIMERLARAMPARGKRLLQTEDEISAIAATIGAGFAGARAATATSGPGLALMVEMLGLGVMAEVPVVIFCSQRGGPSTGMPTKTEQSDLNLAVFGGSGDAQRIVLAPTNVEGCWRCAGKAFEMAERYQVPVIVLLDLYLSNRYETVYFPDEPGFETGRSAGSVEPPSPEEKFRRFQITADGISPRAVPGDPAGVHTATGLEHNEFGRPVDGPDLHGLMSEKRHEKLLPATRHPGITIAKRFGDTGKVDVGILTWGSTFGESLEAMLIAREEGIRCAAMKVVMLSPLPLKAIEKFFRDCREVLVPELNYEGQFAGLVSGALGRPVTRLNRVTGVPMSVNNILDAVRTLARRRRSAA